jgi:hypothetical protein
VSVDGIARAAWQGFDDIYCSFEWQGTTHRTQTCIDCKGSAAWSSLVFDAPLDARTAQSEPLRFAVMQENLVVIDKPVGTAEVMLSSVFPDLQLPIKSGYEPVSHTVTAYEGSKFKRKAKGTITFTAEITQIDAHALEHARRVASAQPTPRDKLEFRLDSGSMSLASRSVDPYALREGSTAADDFSATQLRNAAELLRGWEGSSPIAEPVPIPRSGSKAAANDSKKVDEPFSTEVPPRPAAARKSVAPSMVAAAPAPPTKPRSSMVGAHGKSSLAAAARAATPPTAPPATQQQAPPAGGKANASAGAAPAPAQPATRLRDRRTSALEASTESKQNATPQANDASKPRRPSVGASAKTSSAPAAPKPNTDVVSVAAGKGDALPSKERFGNQAVDEAVRLALRKKGAFLKLTGAEFVSLLDTLLFPVRPELLESSAVLSNIPMEDTQASLLRSRHAKVYAGAPQLEDVNLPIVHAMSLAATISFAIRDGDLLVSSGTQAGRSTPQDSTSGLVAMTQSQSERALQQLQDLVVGPYAAVKACILGLCGGGPGLSEGGPTGRASPALSQITSTTAGGVTTRPSLWTSADVARLLQVLHVRVAPSTDLDGSCLLSLDAPQFKSRFGANPSVDRARLVVYVQALKYLDEWWDRGIRPMDVLAAGADVEGGDVRKSGKGKRRGSKGSVVSSGWGELDSVWRAVDSLEDSDARSGNGKVVQGGRLMQGHLLKIADFQPLLEAMTPLNRAFAWGCSMESLVRFASIIGGMRGYAWVKPSLDTTHPAGVVSSNVSASNLSQGSSIEEKQSQSSWMERAEGERAVAVWLALQKSSANSTTELTQLVRLCNELKVVMKYAPREDEFLVYIPVSCLRVTSVAELKAKKFDAELQGLLLEDLAVGKHVVVAGAEALQRLCERFDWWDRPTAAVLDRMGGQVGEVVSLAEAADKRRVGVRLLDSGLCDALPLEALRLCTVEELRLVRDKVSVQAFGSGDDFDEEAGARPMSGKAGRRKSKAVHSESRKTRLRTLIKSLNNQPEHVPPAAAPVPPATVKPPRAPTPPATHINAKTGAPAQLPVASTHPAPEDGDNKSELSNLSADPDDDEPLPLTSSAKKKRRSFTSRLYSSAPVAAPMPVPAPAPKPKSPTNTAAMMSPSTRIVKRTWVRNTPPHATKGETITDDSPFGDLPPLGDQSSPPPVEQAPSRDDSSGKLDISTDAAVDYSWLRGPKRSPLAFPTDLPEIPAPPPVVVHVSAHSKPSEVPSKSGPVSIHIVRADFDAARAEYTDGVYKYPHGEEHPETPGAGNNPRRLEGAFQPTFVRSSRPQSAPAGAKAKMGKKAVHSPPRAAEEALGIEGNNAHMVTQSSFGLSGVGYAAGGGLQARPNAWVNDQIPAVAEADVPRKIANKQPLHRTDHRSHTSKLFDFHERQQFTPEVDILNDGHVTLGAIDHRTVNIPQRPKSANPTSRGISSKLTARATAGTAKFATAEAEVHAKLDDGDASALRQGVSDIGALHISGGVPPVGGAGTAANTVKRTREEELQHIAAARSNKEMSLKEKVLMKELKRLQGRDKMVI